MSQTGGEVDLEALRMRRKRGVIPKRIWNALVGALKTLRVTSEDERLVVRRVAGVGTAVRLELPGDRGPRQRQFEIRQGEDGDLYVSEGQVVITSPRLDSSGEVSWVRVGHLVEEDSTTPDPEETYGVWLDVTLGSPPTAGPGQYASTGGDVIIEDVAGLEILFSSTYNDTTSATLTSLVGASAGHSYVWLGSAEIDAAGEATIEQADYGPLYVPAITYLDNLISGDSPNQLTQGTDGGLLVP